MANSVEDALNRASDEQREKAQQTIEEARRNIQFSTSNQFQDISSNDAASVTRNAQIIEEAKRTIPAETMKDVSEVSPPPPPLPSHGHVNAAQAVPSAETQANIESIQNTGGNNYLNQNAMDRATDRQNNTQNDMNYSPYIEQQSQNPPSHQQEQDLSR